MALIPYLVLFYFNMKKTFLLILGSLCFVLSNAQTNRIQAYAQEVMVDQTNRTNFIRLKSTVSIYETDVTDFLNSTVFANSEFKTVVVKSEKDDLGFTHVRIDIHYKGIPLFNKQIVAHFRDGKLQTLNGDLSNLSTPVNSFMLSENASLDKALAKVNAKTYKWENKAEEQHMQEVLNQPNFSYAPIGKKVVFEKNGVLFQAYKFTIYAEEPLYKCDVLVDASNGKILDEQNLLCTVNAPAVAATKYSGTQTITVDFTGSLYRLRENARGLGVDTYNCNNTTTYAANDFTNASTSWTTVNVDQVARDAHWGAQKTYDYFFTQHNRNSIDNAGFKLLSYVHYSTNYNNAFWDGTRMTYGDGNGTTYNPFPALDVCGHEITHGLTSNTGNLNYSNESGALNESFSDIFGTVIENYSRPGNWNWKMGEDLTLNGSALREMSNPNLYQDPDTYSGTYWYTGTADNGGVHTNSGVSNFWFYLLSMGGSGINDLNNAYAVNGISISSAARIAFRALTVYFTPTTNYAQARVLTIQAAKDIFGNCSNEVSQTTNAWHAVGVGNAFVPGVVGANFQSNLTSFCTLPAVVNFSNTTSSGLNYVWNFGDGGTSTAVNPIHTYTANGTYHVKLKATGCGNILDSITKNAYIVVNVPNTPSSSDLVGCENTSLQFTATGNAIIKWYPDPVTNQVLGTGNQFSTPNLTATTTYYVANTVTYAPVFGGRLTNTGGGYTSSAGQYLIFNVQQNSILYSVVMYASTAGNRTIELRAANNLVLASTTVSLSTGANTVTLNYNLTPGTNYQLGMNGSSATALYRTNTTSPYPYNIGGYVSITGSSAGAGFYYWFYNWEVGQQECSSPRVPVTASVSPATPVSISATSTYVCKDDGDVPLTTSPSGGILVGNGLNGSNFMPSTGAGNYTITYTYTDNNGCDNSTEVALSVDECTGLQGHSSGPVAITLYPNPFKEVVQIKGEFTEAVRVCVSDALGRKVFVASAKTGDELNLASLSEGLYLVQISNGAGQILGTAKLIRE